jgi:hypothetical protein
MRAAQLDATYSRNEKRVHSYSVTVTAGSDTGRYLWRPIGGWVVEGDAAAAVERYCVPTSKSNPIYQKLVPQKQNNKRIHP